MHIFDHVVRTGVEPTGARGRGNDQDLVLEGLEALQLGERALDPYRGAVVLAAFRIGPVFLVECGTDPLFGVIPCSFSI